MSTGNCRRGKSCVGCASCAQLPDGFEVENFKKPPVVLNPEDPFDAALIPIVETNRRKRRDYAHDSDPFSNFRTTSAMMAMGESFGPIESALFNIHQKVARIQSLRANGRLTDAANESVDDTFLDLAVYSIIAYALKREQSEK